MNAVSVSEWGEVSKALRQSAGLLNAIWQKRPEQVAAGIELAHLETSHLQYNDENALSYTIFSAAVFARRQEFLYGNSGDAFREGICRYGISSQKTFPGKTCSGGGTEMG